MVPGLCRADLLTGTTTGSQDTIPSANRPTELDGRGARSAIERLGVDRQRGRKVVPEIIGLIAPQLDRYRFPRCQARRRVRSLRFADEQVHVNREVGGRSTNRAAWGIDLPRVPPVGVATWDDELAGIAVRPHVGEHFTQGCLEGDASA